MTSGAPPALSDAPAPLDARVGGTMTLLDHLLELRTRLTWSAGAVVAGMSVFFVPAIGFGLMEWLLEPARSAIPDFRPQYIEPMENIVTYFRVALLGGLTLGMPMLIYQFMRFVHPALTPQETRWLYPLVVLASFSFVAGLAFAFYIVLPAALGFLLTFGSNFAEPDIRIGNYIDFVTRIMLVMGLVFETPIVIMGLARLGVVNARQLLGWWRIAIVAAFAVAAIATPTIDPVTQSLVAGPIVILYFAGVALAWLVRPN